MVPPYDGSLRAPGVTAGRAYAQELGFEEIEEAGGCVPLGAFADTWPAGVPVQIHAMAEDPLFTAEGDLDAALNLVDSAGEAELFLYPGSTHLFADISLDDYDETAAPALTARVLEFLARVDADAG